MKYLYIVSIILTLVACGAGENSDGSKKNTYSSCQIVESQALFAADRANDLAQCWNAPGDGYDDQSTALQWCTGKASSYMSRYIFGHTVTYAVESTFCP